MKATDLNLKEMLNFKADEGKLMLGDDRMIILRQDALATLQKLMAEQLGSSLTKALMSQFGYRCGMGDYEVISQSHDWDDEMDKLAAGPVMHAWEGILKAQPTKIEYDREKGNFLMLVDVINSYEAQNYLELFGQANEPICYSNTGYASGWATGFFGAPCLAIETKCVGKGDDQCAFEIREFDSWGPEADSWKEALQATNYSIAKELEEKLTMIEAQRIAIAQLSTPILQVWEGILCLPVIGTVDTARSAEMTDKLLEEVVRTRAKGVIVDLTGIDVVDTRTADHFIKMAKAVKLLGAEPIITGISPAIAQTLTHIGIDITDIRTLRNLQDGLSTFLKMEVKED